MDRRRVSSQATARNSRNPKQVRNSMYAKIKIMWRELRPDLAHSAQELREGLLDFAQAELKLIEPIASLTQLSDRRLGNLIEALTREQRQPSLEGCAKHHIRGTVRLGAEEGIQPDIGGDVHHLASPAQVEAINKVFSYRRWSSEYQADFLKKKFRHSTPSMLTVKQANSALYILLRMTAHRDIQKRAEGEGKTIKKIGRVELGIEINSLKRRLKIDQKEQE